VVTMAVLMLVGQMNGGRPNFWLLSVALCLSIPMAQAVVPISNTLALSPLPHVAGTASSIIGTITFAGGALLGSVVTGAFNGTVRPFSIFVLGYFVVGAAFIFFATAPARAAETR